MPYAIAGERGPERVVPGGGDQKIDVAVYLNGKRFAGEIMPHIVDDIRLKTGVRV